MQNKKNTYSQVRAWKHQSSHPLTNVLIPVNSGIVTRSKFRNMIPFTAYISMVKPKNIKEALEYADWIVAMRRNSISLKKIKYDTCFLSQKTGQSLE